MYIFYIHMHYYFYFYLKSLCSDSHHKFYFLIFTNIINHKLSIYFKFFI
jgi:hypothetical protein